MRSFEELDAFKVSHELTLALHRIVDQLRTRDAELAGQLWHAALIATGRIARGAGCGNRRMFALCLNRSLGALDEINYLLQLARLMDLLPEEAHRELESLRGRANFYVMKLLFTSPTDRDRRGGEGEPSPA
jgi:four helix bundle protein